MVSIYFSINRSQPLAPAELMNDKKATCRRDGGSDVAKIPKQAFYPDLRFVNDCGKKNLLLAGKYIALN
jgi:hypothetical protein